ncbi:MAG: hypothetical protein H7A37_08335 [Chlamydiales bacterium]|nr:hypothetical protein [Chlamydiales bacterium]
MGVAAKIAAERHFTAWSKTCKPVILFLQNPKTGSQMTQTAKRSTVSATGNNITDFLSIVEAYHFVFPMM